MTSDNPDSPLFDCRQCGDCCRGYGGTYVSEEDIRRIAAYIGEDPARFPERYCQMSGRRPVLAQAASGYCVFWDKLCTIHPVKPKMCRRWPFIDAVLVDIQNWKSMGASCPGIQTDLPEDVIREKIATLIKAEDVDK
jgi:hypothetical protein